MDQVATEALLGLEVADSMVGTALLFNPPVFPAFAADYARVPVLAKGFPSKETLVNASPDMVIGSLEYFGVPFFAVILRSRRSASVVGPR